MDRVAGCTCPESWRGTVMIHMITTISLMILMLIGASVLILGAVLLTCYTVAGALLLLEKMRFIG